MHFPLFSRFAHPILLERSVPSNLPSCCFELHEVQTCLTLACPILSFADSSNVFLFIIANLAVSNILSKRYFSFHSYLNNFYYTYPLWKVKLARVSLDLAHSWGVCSGFCEILSRFTFACVRIRKAFLYLCAASSLWKARGKWCKGVVTSIHWFPWSLV